MCKRFSSLVKGERLYKGLDSVLIRERNGIGAIVGVADEISDDG